ncbi:hypothetical protein A5634_26485 [Mycobacterium asiaticum]|uniref:Serine/threonine protein kinase n=2 Tax=Mycobacterium asiaticum TaxID=1790 RepID=A0A1A3NWN5_MYCAS|nr:hypothetical protein A5634_26485 [Mycobacterium asiaticum]
MLPQGFSTANCKEVDPTPPALERVMCEKSSDPNGPSHAVFLLYANNDDLAAALQGVGSSGYTVVSSCPGGQASPEKWSYGNSGQTAGQVECATSVENVATVIWTDNTKLRLGVVEGNGKDIAGLYNWWSAKS